MVAHRAIVLKLAGFDDGSRRWFDARLLRGDSGLRFLGLLFLGLLFSCRMGRSMLEDAFGHHAWATLRVIDACLELSPEQLETAVPGTYGSILDTVRHTVGADSSYLFVMSGGRTSPIDEDHMDLPELRATMVGHAAAWSSVLAQDPDPDAIVVRRRDDGSETHAPSSIRLAQALHHGTDHRSQICTALTTLGVEPPLIDVWDFGGVDGSVVEIPPTS
jgi:uncharacterized damage-inducible protein DinB